MTRVLVTGAAGFIGRHVLAALTSLDAEPIGLDIVEPPGEFRWIECDVTDAEALHSAVGSARPDVVIHLAGLLGTAESFDRGTETCHTNVCGTINVLEACRRSGSRYLGVETGTDWLSVYAISKRATTELAEAYSIEYQLPVVVLRVFNAYGPHQRGTYEVQKIIPRFSVDAWSGRALPVFGDGEQTIDLVHVDDCAMAFAACATQPPGRAFEVIDVGTGEPISVLDIANRVIGIVGRGAIDFFPKRRGEGSAYPVADPARIAGVLGYKPTLDPDRMTATVHWYRRLVPANGQAS